MDKGILYDQHYTATASQWSLKDKGLNFYSAAYMKPDQQRFTVS